MDNCTSSLNNLLAILKVKFTKQYLEDTILSHPDHPSILTVSDTLSKYQIENLPVKVDGNKLKEFHSRSGETFFGDLCTRQPREYTIGIGRLNVQAVQKIQTALKVSVEEMQWHAQVFQKIIVFINKN